LTVVLIVIAGFVLSKNEDARLQVMPWAISCGIVAALKIGSLIGIGFVMLPGTS